MTASHDNHNHKSILGDVARHEKELLAKLDASRDDARKIVERARADAAKHISDESARVQSDIADLRTRADLKRTQAFESAVSAAEQSLVGRRQAAVARVPELARQVMDFFLPKGGRQ